MKNKIVAQISLEELKTALRLEGKGITHWITELRNPEGNQVVRTNVYQALNHGSPQWLVDEIKLKIRSSKKKYSEYWKSIQNNDDAKEESLQN